MAQYWLVLQKAHGGDALAALSRSYQPTLNVIALIHVEKLFHIDPGNRVTLFLRQDFEVVKQANFFPGLKLNRAAKLSYVCEFLMLLESELL